LKQFDQSVTNHGVFCLAGTVKAARLVLLAKKSLAISQPRDECLIIVRVAVSALTTCAIGYRFDFDFQLPVGLR
jgi:hypothetical protein